MPNPIFQALRLISKIKRSITARQLFAKNILRCSRNLMSITRRNTFFTSRNNFHANSSLDFLVYSSLGNEYSPSLRDGGGLNWEGATPISTDRPSLRDGEIPCRSRKRDRKVDD